MTVGLHLSDGKEFFVHMDIDELTHKLRSALDENQFLILIQQVAVFCVLTHIMSCSWKLSSAHRTDT
jgi:hypothetical protein